MDGRRPSGWYDVYFFDLDGTVYLGDEMLPTATATIETLKAAGKTVRYLSNNPTRTPGQYADKLTRLGVPTAPADVITTIATTVWWLRQHHPGARVFPIAEAPLIDALLAAGVTVTDDPDQIDIVIASYDRTFVYSKLQTAFDALTRAWRQDGVDDRPPRTAVDKVEDATPADGAGRPSPALLIQTNPDRFCPFPGGRGEPDAGAITAAIEACTQVKCSANMGKPSPYLLQAGLVGLDAPLDHCLMTGDRLATDIGMALDAGMDAAVVFTGESQPTDVTGRYSGVYRLDCLADLLLD